MAREYYYLGELFALKILQRMRRFSSIRSASKGQSFVELALVALLLMLLVAGIAEYGVLLNRYLNLLDGVREAARFNANLNPFCPHDSTDPNCPPDTVTADYFKKTACELEDVIYPIQLDRARGDDIVISFFAVKSGSIVSRVPVAEAERGWSWRQNGDVYTDSPCSWAGDGTRNQSSKQTQAFVQSRIDPSAPDVSVALVEVFYNYPQTLKAPFFEQVFPDPIPVYIYAIMPIKYDGP
jgi:hypothetical protein